MSVELVEVVRSGMRECVHRGSLVVCDPDGEIVVALGEVHTPLFPRSCTKPLQSVAMLRAGYRPRDAAELAVATASHEAEPVHIAQVADMLDRHGMTEAALLCPPDLPANPLARAEVLVSGTGPRPIYMNCSGKHAAMLATCRAAGWPIDSYPDENHPLQRVVTDTILEFTGQAPETADDVDVGVDGCGLPVVPASLVGLARAYGALVTASPGTPERAVADAVREHPLLVSGTDRDDLTLMTAVPGAMTKQGADGMQVGALADGSSFAFRIEDGGDRARLPIAVAALRLLGASFASDPAPLANRPVLGGGVRVGTIRTIPGVFPA